MASHAEHYRERKRCLQVLNLPESASEGDIKTSYKSLARQWHPDKNKAADATEKMQEITAAYNYLIKGHSVLNHVDNDDDEDLIDAYMHLFPWLFTQFYQQHNRQSKFFFPFNPFGYDDSSSDDGDYCYYSTTSRPKPQGQRYRGSQQRGSQQRPTQQYSAGRSDRRNSPPQRQPQATGDPKQATAGSQQFADDRAARKRDKKQKQKQRKKEEKAATQAARATSGQTKTQHSAPAPSVTKKESQVPSAGHRTNAPASSTDKKENQVPNVSQAQKAEQEERSGTSETSDHSHQPAPSAPPKKTKQQLKEEQRRRDEEMAQIAKDLKEKMEQEREKKARKQAAKEEKERQEAEERRRQEELEIQEEARRIREIEQRREEELTRKRQEEEVKKHMAKLLEEFDDGIYLDASGDFVTTDAIGVGNIKKPPVNYGASGYQGFGDEDQFGTFRDQGDNHSQPARGRGRGMGQGQYKGDFSAFPRDFNGPVRQDFHHLPPQQGLGNAQNPGFGVSPPQHMTDRGRVGLASAMGQGGPPFHNARGGFRGSSIPQGRGTPIQRGQGDVGHAAFQGGSDADYSQPPPGFSKPSGDGSDRVKVSPPHAVNDSSRFQSGTAQPPSSADKLTQFLTRGSNLSQTPGQGPKAHPPPLSPPTQGFPRTPPRPLQGMSSFLSRPPPPATFAGPALIMPPPFIPLQQPPTAPPPGFTALPGQGRSQQPHKAPPLAPAANGFAGSAKSATGDQPRLPNGTAVNSNMMPSFLSPSLISATGTRTQRPYIAPFGSPPSKVSVPFKPGNLAPRPSGDSSAARSVTSHDSAGSSVNGESHSGDNVFAVDDID